MAALSAFSILSGAGIPARAADDPLPSWHAGPSRDAIIRFVQQVTTPGGKDFVEPRARIAVFDNDGTLWCERPLYAQLLFAMDRVKELAPRHPEWREQEPFRSVLTGDMKGVEAAGVQGMLDMTMATHAGITTEEFAGITRDWLRKARHPRFDRPYPTLVYQPMLEVLAWLRANGFKTYIVSGGGVEFVRAYAERVYGIPPELVIGSRIETKYELRDGKPVLMRQLKIDFIDDQETKPVAIEHIIGRRPLMAFGNSDGDFQMLEWTTSGSGPRFGMLIHHTDAEREYAYDRNSPVGRLARGLDEASDRGWLVADMKKDWKVVFPPQ